jgi:hypothetical protein
MVRYQVISKATTRSETFSSVRWDFQEFSIDVQNILADGDLVVALVTVNARRKGIAESFPEVHVWRMKNGKAIEFREYQGDEQREDRFWS